MTVRRVLKWMAIAVLALLAVLVALVLWPASTEGLASTPTPVTDYQRAMAEVERIRTDERDDVIRQPGAAH